MWFCAAKKHELSAVKRVQAIEPGRFRAAKKGGRNAVKRVSNHTHIVLSVDPKAVFDWTDGEVGDR